MRLIALGLLIGLAPASVLAAPPEAPTASTPAGSKPAAAAPTVSSVTVFPATDAPKVTKSYPAASQALSAGVLVLSVTFDQPMLPGGFDFGPAAGGEQPHCLKTPRLLDDKRTFVVLCTTEPAKAYALTFNAKPQGGFQNVAEHRAEPSTLSFKTTDGEGPRDVHEALKAAGLREVDMPILESPDRRADISTAAKSP